MTIGKRALVLGAGGFIGGHMVDRLMRDGYSVVASDIKHHEFRTFPKEVEFRQADLRHLPSVEHLMRWTRYDIVIQLAADMGGAGFVFTKENDAEILHNSTTINLNVLDAISRLQTPEPPTVFFASSACIYPEHNQLDPDNPNCEESTAYPADPDSDYGFEKLYSERLFLAYSRNKGIPVRIARFHNIFGRLGTYDGGREKAPAAMCRKVAQAPDGGTIQVWGDGKQTRSFLHYTECIDGVMRLMASDHSDPINIGSDEMVTINQLAEMAIDISGKKLNIEHIPGPQGVRGRCSDNTKIEQVLGWRPTGKLRDGMEDTYQWIASQISSRN